MKRRDFTKRLGIMLGLSPLAACAIRKRSVDTYVDNDWHHVFKDGEHTYVDGVITHHTEYGTIHLKESWVKKSYSGESIIDASKVRKEQIDAIKNRTL